MGTAELYRVEEGIEPILDSLAVDLEYLGCPSYMALFVQLLPGVFLEEPLRQRIQQYCAMACPPIVSRTDILHVSIIYPHFEHRFRAP